MPVGSLATGIPAEAKDLAMTIIQRMMPLRPARGMLTNKGMLTPGNSKELPNGSHLLKCLLSPHMSHSYNHTEPHKDLWRCCNSGQKSVVNFAEMTPLISIHHHHHHHQVISSAPANTRKTHADTSQFCPCVKQHRCQPNIKLTIYSALYGLI